MRVVFLNVSGFFKRMAESNAQAHNEYNKAVRTLPLNKQAFLYIGMRNTRI